MAEFNLYRDCEDIVKNIKNASWFPYKQGVLKLQATQGQLISDNVYKISFSSQVAPYVEYLEEGTGPHNIPKAFGRPLPFGTYGRFDGKFHPGSVKHKGFIKEKCIKEIIDYFVNKYDGMAVTI